MPEARTDAWGRTTFDASRVWKKSTVYTPSSLSPPSYSQGTVTVREADNQRERQSNNPLYLKFGVLPWRDPSSYTRYVQTYEYSPCDFYSVSPYGKGTVSVRYEGYFSIEVAHISDLFTYPLSGQGSMETMLSERNRARTECLLKLKEKKVNVGTFLAESISTYDMMAGQAKNLFQLLLYMKRGQFNRIPRLFYGNGKGPQSARLASGILEMKYGWMPLISDLKAAYDDFQGTTPRPMLLSASRNVKTPWKTVSNSTYWTNRVQDLEVRNTCKIIAKLSSDFMAKANSYGLINPLALGWEVIPFSFVIDWAMPIGNVLEAMSATAGLDFVGGFENQTITGTVDARRPVPSGYTGKGVGVHCEYLCTRREKLLGFPTPLPYVKSPFSTQNGLSALALWRQLLF